MRTLLLSIRLWSPFSPLFEVLRNNRRRESSSRTARHLCQLIFSIFNEKNTSCHQLQRFCWSINWNDDDDEVADAINHRDEMSSDIRKTSNLSSFNLGKYLYWWHWYIQSINKKMISARSIQAQEKISFTGSREQFPSILWQIETNGSDHQLNRIEAESQSSHRLAFLPTTSICRYVLTIWLDRLEWLRIILFHVLPKAMKDSDTRAKRETCLCLSTICVLIDVIFSTVYRRGEMMTTMLMMTMTNRRTKTMGDDNR